MNKILTTTLGSATDLQSEGLRRMLVNGALWSIGLEKKIPEESQGGLRRRIQAHDVWLQRIQERHQAVRTRFAGEALIQATATVRELNHVVAQVTGAAR